MERYLDARDGKPKKNMETAKNCKLMFIRSHSTKVGKGIVKQLKNYLFHAWLSLYYNGEDGSKLCSYFMEGFQHEAVDGTQQRSEYDSGAFALSNVDTLIRNVKWDRKYSDERHKNINIHNFDAAKHVLSMREKMRVDLNK